VTTNLASLDIQPVTADRWPDLAELFERPGPRGSWPRTSACYCMFWRLPSAEYEAAFRRRSLESVSGGPNKEAMRKLVAAGTVPGLLASLDGRAVGWVAVSPRAELVRLDSSPGLHSAAEPPDARAWSVSCFYVHRSAWRRGVGTALLDAAVARAVERGATMIEGYPVQAGSVDPYTAYGTMFADARFRLVQPGRGKGRALWRRDLS
jgi:GNAT superfamily N-acetyltransferase